MSNICISFRAVKTAFQAGVNQSFLKYGSICLYLKINPEKGMKRCRRGFHG